MAFQPEFQYDNVAPDVEPQSKADKKPYPGKRSTNDRNNERIQRIHESGVLASVVQHARNRGDVSRNAKAPKVPTIDELTAQFTQMSDELEAQCTGGVKNATAALQAKIAAAAANVTTAIVGHLDDLWATRNAQFASIQTATTAASKQADELVDAQTKQLTSLIATARTRVTADKKKAVDAETASRLATIKSDQASAFSAAQSNHTSALQQAEALRKQGQAAAHDALLSANGSNAGKQTPEAHAAAQHDANQRAAAIRADYDQRVRDLLKQSSTDWKAATTQHAQTASSLLPKTSAVSGTFDARLTTLDNALATGTIGFAAERDKAKAALAAQANEFSTRGYAEIHQANVQMTALGKIGQKQINDKYAGGVRAIETKSEQLNAAVLRIRSLKQQTIAALHAATDDNRPALVASLQTKVTELEKIASAALHDLQTATTSINNDIDATAQRIDAGLPSDKQIGWFATRVKSANERLATYNDTANQAIAAIIGTSTTHMSQQYA